MSEQVLNQFRSDKALRDDCVAIYSAMGLDLNTAFRMFMERTRMVRGLPFPAVLPAGYIAEQKPGKAVFAALRNQATELPELSLDEINAEIAASRAEKRAQK